MPLHLAALVVEVEPEVLEPLDLCILYQPRKLRAESVLRALRLVLVDQVNEALLRENFLLVLEVLVA